MRIADMGDMGTHVAGRRVKIGNWHYMDRIDGLDESRIVRYVYHYGTCMGVLSAEAGRAGWGLVEFHPWNMGWGSVSDQNGMNAILRRACVPLVYRRNGGVARYEEVTA